MIYFLIQLWVGLFCGVMFAVVVVLPLVYGFPRAFFDALRGRAVWWAPLRYLFGPVLGCLAIIAVGFLSAGLAPGVLLFVQGAGFVWGQLVAIGLALLNCFTPTGRHNMNASYLKTVRLRGVATEPLP